jgi:hypothetical protein
MVIEDFKKLVSDYMNRDSTLFDSNSSSQVDKLLLAINNAKSYSQRKLQFELARTTVAVVIDKDVGGDLSTAVGVDSGDPIRIQNLERAFLPSTDGVTFYPVDITNRNSNIKDLQRLVENIFDPRLNNVITPPSFAKIVRFGNKVYVAPWDTRLYTTQTLTARFDVVQWMPPYGSAVVGTATSTSAFHLVDSAATFITNGVAVGDVVYNTTASTSATVTAVSSETDLTLSADIFESAEAYKVGTKVQEDFFLIECIDYMLYRTIQELNLFLKEDQRVVISANMMNDAWETVKSWNSRLAYSNEQYNLD